MDLAAATEVSLVISKESAPSSKDGVDIATTCQSSDAWGQLKELSPEAAVDNTANTIPIQTLECGTSPTKLPISRKSLRPKAPMTYKFEPFDESVLLTPPADSDQGPEKRDGKKDSSNPSKPGKKRGRPFKLDAQGNPSNVKRSLPQPKKTKTKTKKTTVTNAAPKLEINETDQPFAKIQKQNILKLRSDGHREYLDEHIMGPLYRSLQKILSEKPDRPLQTLANLLLEEDKRLSNNSIL